MSDMPFTQPVNDAPAQKNREGGEFSFDSKGADYGSMVDAFNDMAGERQSAEGKSGSRDFTDEMQDLTGDGLPPGEGAGESESPWEEVGDDSSFEGEQETDIPSEGDQEGGEAGEDATGSDEANPTGENEINDTVSENSTSGKSDGEIPKQSDEQDGKSDTGYSSDQPDSQSEGDESEKEETGKGDTGGTEDDDRGRVEEEDTTRDRDHETPEMEEKNTTAEDNDEPIDKNDLEKENKFRDRRNDSIFDRIQRGELTEKDLETLEKDIKKQQDVSVTPKDSWLPKGGGGGTHANPKQTDPSPLERQQSELKARTEKQDEVQAWNDKFIQRAKAEEADMWERLRNMNKG